MGVSAATLPPVSLTCICVGRQTVGSAAPRARFAAGSMTMTRSFNQVEYVAYDSRTSVGGAIVASSNWSMDRRTSNRRIDPARRHACIRRNEIFTEMISSPYALNIAIRSLVVSRLGSWSYHPLQIYSS